MLVSDVYEHSGCTMHYSSGIAGHLPQAPSQKLCRVATLQTEKNPGLFQTKLQMTYRRNAHLLIQNLLVTNFGVHFSNWLGPFRLFNFWAWPGLRAAGPRRPLVSMHITVLLPAYCQGVAIKYPWLHKFPHVCRIPWHFQVSEISEKW